MRFQTFKQNDKRVRIEIFQNDGFTLRATLHDENGDAVVLTDKTIVLHAKRNLFDSSTKFDINGIISNATSGIVDFQFTTTHTADVALLKAEIEVNSGTGLDETIAVFNLDIRRDVG